MSKDKGGKKDQKKAPADKSSTKGKAVSSYKSESGGGKSATASEALAQKPDAKAGGKAKS